mmetsp:Transcript_17517/g.42622  ORF Transcript_17517/g.42622 Transcript_17517/m.42622 type:complete len:396 (+) Transcript_17517:310-1497(+)|eukprot:CAMPEP_0113464056 /NCGR_PEP_ID=MMETSP0014_2-20120614/12993_1 /TAXON_ID=2857 /ORGANISM="Nitzschia sp." /LENGTH=395 /DNA_ID=CAMNT_0000356103 /DNA_START=221 /DNA_END=1408 /DNA_ORIENTATION=+ /assembly_acc=CAM_ASM_000159
MAQRKADHEMTINEQQAQQTLNLEEVQREEEEHEQLIAATNAATNSNSNTNTNGSMVAFDRAMFVATSRAADLNELGVLHMKQRKFRQATASFANALSLLNVEVLSSPVFQAMEQREVEGEEQEEEEEVGVEAETTAVEVEDDSYHPDDHSATDQDIDTSATAQIPAPLEDLDTAATTPTASIDGGEVVSKEQCERTSSVSVHHVDKPTGTAEATEQCQQHTTASLDMQEDLLYRTPISFNDVFMRETASSYHGVVEMSISIMFNFALSHQLTAVSGQSPNPVVTLGHSISLYELAHSLQLHEGIDLGMEHTMATINNLGHIHRVLGDEDKAMKCFQHLLSILMYLQVQEQIDGSRNLDNEESMSSTRRCLIENEIFFESVSPLILSDVAAAPAA